MVCTGRVTAQMDGERTVFVTGSSEVVDSVGALLVRFKVAILVVDADCYPIVLELLV